MTRPDGRVEAAKLSGTPAARGPFFCRVARERPHAQQERYRARASYQAYVDKDRAAIERLIAPELRFFSPLDNGLDRATYFERCWPNSETIAHFDIIYLIENGDSVVITYESISTKGHRFRNTEILTITRDQITRVEVYFGWSIPHPAAPGKFVDEKDGTRHP